MFGSAARGSEANDAARRKGSMLRAIASTWWLCPQGAGSCVTRRPREDAVPWQCDDVAFAAPRPSQFATHQSPAIGARPRVATTTSAGIDRIRVTEPSLPPWAVPASPQAYSYLSARIGSIRLALCAGISPAIAETRGEQ